MHRQPGQPPARLLLALFLLACLFASLPVPAEVITHELLRSAQEAPDISQIAFSQDETCAVYVRGDEIYFAFLDGVSEPVRKYKGDNLEDNVRQLFISPDSSRALFQMRTGTGNELHIVGLKEGVDDLRLVNVAGWATPNQHWLVWRAEEGQNLFQVWSLKLSALSEPTLLFNMRTGVDLRLTDTHAAFKVGNRIEVAPVDGASPPVFVRETYGNFDTDSRFLYFTEYDREQRRNFTFAVFPPSPEVLIPIDAAPSPPVSNDFNYIPASSSPDGRYIASRVGSTLAIVSTGNSEFPSDPEFVRQTIEPNSRPIWSPDSRFACLNINLPLRLIDTFSPSQVVNLPTNSSVQTIAFSNDSSKIVYRTYSDAIFVIDLLDGFDAAKFLTGGRASGPYLDSSSKTALFTTSSGLFSIGLDSLQMEKIGPTLENLATSMVLTSRAPATLLLPAGLTGYGSAPCRLNTSYGGLTPLTPLPESIPSDLAILGVSPQSQTLYFQVQDTISSQEGVHAIVMGVPSRLHEVYPQAISDPERMFRLAGPNSDAYFLTNNSTNTFVSRLGEPASQVFNELAPLNERSNYQLTMAPTGEFGLVTRERRYVTYNDCCYLDDNEQCNWCTWESIVYQHIFAQEVDRGGNILLPLTDNRPMQILIEPNGQRILLVYLNYENNWYRNRIVLTTPTAQSVGWIGNLLGKSSQLDCAISESTPRNDPGCPFQNCSRVSLSRIYMNAALETQTPHLDTFHIYDAIALTQYSEPTGRLVLQPSDGTLQTLSVLPGAVPVVVDGRTDTTRGGLVLSPDGKFAAYVRVANDSGISSVCVTELASDTPARQLSTWARGDTFAAVDALTFSPASNAVLFIATEHSGNTCLYTAAPDASVPAIRRTPTSLEVVRYVVSPDSAWVAYAARDAGAPDDGVLTWYSVPLFGGSNAPLIDTDDTLEGDPVWAGGNLYWIAKEETARVLYAAEPTLSPPAFATQPRPKGPHSVGRSAFLAVRLVEPGSATLRWEFAPSLPGGALGPYAPLTNTGGIRGATAHTLRINATRPATQFAGRYRCVATNAAGIAFSRPVQIEVQ